MNSPKSKRVHLWSNTGKLALGSAALLSKLKRNLINNCLKPEAFIHLLLFFYFYLFIIIYYFAALHSIDDLKPLSSLSLNGTSETKLPPQERRQLGRPEETTRAPPGIGGALMASQPAPLPLGSCSPGVLPVEALPAASRGPGVAGGSAAREGGAELRVEGARRWERRVPLRIQSHWRRSESLGG